MLMTFILTLGCDFSLGKAVQRMTGSDTIRQPARTPRTRCFLFLEKLRNGGKVESAYKPRVQQSRAVDRAIDVSQVVLGLRRLLIACRS